MPSSPRPSRPTNPSVVPMDVTPQVQPSDGPTAQLPVVPAVGTDAPTPTQVTEPTAPLPDPGRMAETMPLTGTVPVSGTVPPTGTMPPTGTVPLTPAPAPRRTPVPRSASAPVPTTAAGSSPDAGPRPVTPPGPRPSDEDPLPLIATPGNPVRVRRTSSGEDSGSGGAPTPPPAPAHPVQLGLVVSPRVAEHLRSSLTDDLPALLEERLPGARWDVHVVEEGLVRPPADFTELVGAGRHRLLEEDWDLAVVLTDLPLHDGRRTVRTQASPAHGVGLLSVPALGGVNVRHRVREAVVGLAAALLGHDPDGADDEARAVLARRLRELSTQDQAQSTGSPAQVAARVLGGNVGLLLGMVRANRPWRLALGLSRALTAAAAATAFALVTTDLWLLADAYSVGRLLLLALVAVLAVSAALVVGARLWERPRRRRQRRQVALLNAATTATVVIGVLVLHVALLLVALLGALLVLHAGVVAQVLGHEPDQGTYLRLAWLTASLATVGGALGAGLEGDDTVRAAAYAQQDRVRTDDE